MSVDDAERMLAKVGSFLMDKEHLFFGTEKLKHKLLPGNVPSVCTDGRETIWYNPDYVMSQGLLENVFVMVHEITHITDLHPIRAIGLKDMGRANRAADYVINIRLVDAGYKAPKDILLDYRFRNMSFEQVYRVLEQEEEREDEEGGPEGDWFVPSDDESSGQGEGDESSGPGNAPEPFDGDCGSFTTPKDEAGNELDESGRAELQREILGSVISSAQAAKGAGKLSGWVEKLIEGHKNPEVPWTQYLRDYVRALSQRDYTWQQPEESYLQQGFYVPSLNDLSVGEIVVAEDVSGSMDTALHPQLVAETQEILDVVQPECLHFLQFQDRVIRDDEYKPGDKVDETYRGGGGTNFVPIFQHIEEQGYSPVCLIVLSDMDAYDLREIKEPSYPVLWVSYGGTNLPFGDVLEVKSIR